MRTGWRASSASRPSTPGEQVDGDVAPLRHEVTEEADGGVRIFGDTGLLDDEGGLSPAARHDRIPDVEAM